MNPPKGMVSPRGPVFAAIVERVEAPDPDTVVIHGKGPSGLLLPLFANGWNVIIPQAHCREGSGERLEDHGHWHGAVSAQGTAHVVAVEEYNPEYFKKGLPFLDEIEIHIITDPQALVAAILSKRVFWSDSFHPNMDRDLSQAAARQNPNLVRSSTPFWCGTPHAANRETALR